MPDERRRETLDTAISGDTAHHFLRELKNHDSRMVIKDVVTEHTSSSLFADRIKTIQLENLESTETYKKISDKVQNQIDKTLSDRGLKNRNFWLPFFVSAIGVAVAIAAIVISMMGAKATP